MKVARNMAELSSMIMREVRNAMVEAHAKSVSDTEQEVNSFYSQGSPLIYERTGKLGNSVRNTNVSSSGNSCTFSIWLDQDYSYDMPNTAFTDLGFASYFTTPMVLEAAEAGTARIKGKPGFWNRSTNKIENNLKTSFASRFQSI